jgi:hypothetical protein
MEQKVLGILLSASPCASVCPYITNVSCFIFEFVLLLDRSNESFNERNICDADSLSRVTPGTYFSSKNINKRDRKL